jgi:glycosyltransferase involved in cell wall biosynthesis
LKIGLNATCLNDRPSGAKHRFIGIYSELFKRLSESEFIVYEPADCQISRWFEASENISYRKTPLSSESRFKRYLGGLSYWPKALRAEGFDIFEGFHLPLVRSPTGHTVLTIHDIRGFSEENGLIARALYKDVFERSLEKADQVITVSESVRTEILNRYPNTSISVIYNGIDIDAYADISEPEMLDVRQHLGLPDDYLLAVGHFEKRKNYVRLIEAVAKLHERGSKLQLVIIGNDSGELPSVRERIQDLRLSKHVTILSGLTDLEVRCVYKQCALFVFPSAYEGFGIPILEAMAAKRPMVISDIPVFKEITQGKGAYFSHDDADSIATAIDEVLTATTEQSRLVEYGSDRVLDFGFERISKSLEQIYGSLK